jgi:hypothetical protein
MRLICQGNGGIIFVLEMRPQKMNVLNPDLGSANAISQSFKIKLSANYSQPGL